LLHIPPHQFELLPLLHLQLITMSSKAALKAVRSAIDAKDYATAVEKARSLLQQDPKNYHGYVMFPPRDREQAHLTFPPQLGTSSSDSPMTSRITPMKLNKLT
jgi:hypothetical protein